jgi:SAM-dependent methyltransferase
MKSRIAHSYDEREDMARRNINELKMAGLAFAGKRIADLGCGTGAYARIMAEEGSQCVIGIDKEWENANSAMLAGAKGNVHYVIGDIDNAPLKRGFDIVFMRGSIYYLKKEPGSTMEKIGRLLKPRGDLFVTFMGPTIGARFLNNIKEIAAKTPEFAQPAVKVLMAVIYWVTAFAIEMKTQDWREINGKMATLFFPIRWLTAREEAVRMMLNNGFDIMAEFDKQGGNPSLTSEYAIWARKRTDT